MASPKSFDHDICVSLSLRSTVSSDDTGALSGVDKAASEDSGNDESSDGSNGGEASSWAKANGPAEAGSAVDKEVQST